MDTLHFGQFDIKIAATEDAGDVLAKFEALQDIVQTILLVATHSPMNPELRIAFYAWYTRHLAKLHREAMLAAQDPPYHIKSYPTFRVALRRIEAVIEALDSVEVPKELAKDLIQLRRILTGTA